MAFALGDWAVLTLPDGSLRMAQCRAQTVDLGRFGKFDGTLLVGAVSGAFFKIEPDASLVPTSPFAIEACGDEEAVEAGTAAPVMATNRLISDSNTSQRLSTSDVEGLKSKVDAGALTDREVVDEIVRNSDTFQLKNAFSKIKYVERKRRKFLRWFSLARPTVRLLTRCYVQRDPHRILDLRLDSLSQLCALANLQPAHGHYMVWDETLAFVTGVLLSKLDPATSMVLHVHALQQMQGQALMHFNFTKEARTALFSTPLEALCAPEAGQSAAAAAAAACRREEEDATPEAAEIREERQRERLAKRQRITAAFAGGRFDALIVVTAKRCPIGLLGALSAGLRPSARLVIYSPYRELLLPCHEVLRQAEGWIDVSLTESWLRPYQPAPGRIHPEMTCNGATGTLLAATRSAPTARG